MDVRVREMVVSLVSRLIGRGVAPPALGGSVVTRGGGRFIGHKTRGSGNHGRRTRT